MKKIYKSLEKMNLPQSRSTYAFIAMSAFLLLISLRWLFTHPDPSVFLTYILIGALFGIIAYLIETVDFLKHKCINLDKRLDSHIYDNGNGGAK